MPIYLQIGPFKIQTTVTKYVTSNMPVMDESQAIKGTSTDGRHLRWLEIESCSYDPATGGVGDTAMSFTRTLDGASARLLNMVASPPGPLMALVDFASDSIGSLLTRRVTLLGVVVASYSRSGDQGRMETFVLRYTNISTAQQRT